MEGAGTRSLPPLVGAVCHSLTPRLELGGLVEAGPFSSGSVEALMASHASHSLGCFSSYFASLFLFSPWWPSRDSQLFFPFPSEEESICSSSSFIFYCAGGFSWLVMCP